MSNQHLESKINELSARVTRQDVQIAALEKQLTDMQAVMSCGRIEVIKLDACKKKQDKSLHDFTCKVNA